MIWKNSMALTITDAHCDIKTRTASHKQTREDGNRHTNRHTNNE